MTRLDITEETKTDISEKVDQFMKPDALNSISKKVEGLVNDIHETIKWGIIEYMDEELKEHFRDTIQREARNMVSSLINHRPEALAEFYCGYTVKNLVNLHADVLKNERIKQLEKEVARLENYNQPF